MKIDQENEFVTKQIYLLHKIKENIAIASWGDEAILVGKFLDIVCDQMSNISLSSKDNISQIAAVMYDVSSLFSSDPDRENAKSEVDIWLARQTASR